MDLSAGGFVVARDTVVWSFVIGIGVTVLAAVFPARRAEATPPVAAMRDDALPPIRSLHRRVVLGTLVTAAGAVVLGFGLVGATGEPLALVGAEPRWSSSGSPR